MKAVVLTRVSTSHQTEKGSSLKQQARVCKEFCERYGLEVVETLVEVGSGGATERPVLERAMKLCKEHDARLVVKSLSRLSRRVAFVAGILEEGLRFHIVELGYRELTTFELHLWASFAQMERERISERVKAGLVQARKNGKVLGNPRLDEFRERAQEAKRKSSVAYVARIMKYVGEIRNAGVTTQQGIADCLNARGIKTARGGSFRQSSVSYVMKKHELWSRAA
tara:strand:+ start:307 stop:981 length:675 start_codon:yes stop_codon:yes gene_type:complete